MAGLIDRFVVIHCPDDHDVLHGVVKVVEVLASGQILAQRINEEGGPAIGPAGEEISMYLLLPLDRLAALESEVFDTWEEYRKWLDDAMDGVEQSHDTSVERKSGPRLLHEAEIVTAINAGRHKPEGQA